MRRSSSEKEIKRSERFFSVVFGDEIVEGSERFRKGKKLVFVCDNVCL